MVRPWTHHYANTGLWYGEADPADEALNAVDGGTEPDAREVADFLRGRIWLQFTGDWRPRCLQFGTEDSIIGYATILVRKKYPHPTKEHSARRRYLFIGQLLVESAFQGAHDPKGHGTYAEEIVGALIEIAKQEKCVGICLDVRPSNDRALRFWARVGFQEDTPYHSEKMGGEMFSRRLIFD
jgi:ribosomal protein S18 acetylase RimI-like enzyme